MTRVLASATFGRVPKQQVSLEFKLEDCWIGAYWRSGTVEVIRHGERTRECGTARRVEAWLCLVPCLPIHVIAHVGWKQRWWEFREAA